MQIDALKTKIQEILDLDGPAINHSPFQVAFHRGQALGYAQALRDTGAITSQECTEIKDLIFATQPA